MIQERPTTQYDMMTMKKNSSQTRKYPHIWYNHEKGNIGQKNILVVVKAKKLKKITQGYANAVRALDTTWYNHHKQSAQEYKHLASTVIAKKMGRWLEYRNLIQHPKCKDDWLMSGAN